MGGDPSPPSDAENADDDGTLDSNAEHAPMTSTSGDIAIPSAVRNAVKALFAALGTPVIDEHWAGDEEAKRGCHPIFDLAEHYRGNDSGARGYTANPYRGDHMSIPHYTEDGDVFVLDISFHKGDTVLTRVDYPHGSGEIRKALLELLESCETR